MRIRLASPADMDALVALFDEYRRFNGKPSDKDGAREFLSLRLRRREAVVFLAEVDHGGVAGFAQLFPSFSSVSLGTTFIVNDLYVDPAHRRKGVGSALLQAAAQHARTTGAVRLSASTAIDNTPTQILNERNGFVRDQSFYVYHMRTIGSQ